MHTSDSRSLWGPRLARLAQCGLALLLLAGTLLATSPGRAGANGAQTGDAQTSAAATIYLPLLAGGSGAGPSPRPTPDPDPEPTSAGFFVEPEKKTSRPGVAIDPQGGLHMAYRYHVPYAQHPQVVYAYCPAPSSQCGDAARWGRVAFLDRAEEVQIELTPAGKPRLLALIGDAEGSLSSLFVYAECDSDCLKEESWSRIGVTTKTDTLGSALSYYTPKCTVSCPRDPHGSDIVASASGQV